MKHDVGSLRDEVRAYKSHHGPPCSVCRFPPDVLSEVNAILREDGACHKALVVALAGRGIKTSKGCIGNHYREGHHVKPS